jgi:hypothetical protein
MFGKDGFDQIPQFVRHQQLAHHVLLDSNASYSDQKVQVWQWPFLEALSILLCVIQVPLICAVCFWNDRELLKGIGINVAVTVLWESIPVFTAFPFVIVALLKRRRYQKVFGVLGLLWSAIWVLIALALCYYVYVKGGPQ